MRILRTGSIGPAVELLQLALNRAGAGELETDGIFGPATAAALRRFQGREGLVTDAIAGRETHRALLPWYTGVLLYRVERGDTFWKLAERWGTSVEAIALANPGSQAENLQIGETLVIPLPFPVVPTTIRYSAALVEYCARGLSARYPFCRSGEIGRSVMGKPLVCLTLGSGKDAVLYNAEHHANEWITTPLLLKFCEDLASAFAAGGAVAGRSAAELLSNACLSLVPAVNPDGLDLVTGELQQGEFYRGALQIANDRPDLPFPGGWKANIRGTDLNLQYPADWERARELKCSLGVCSPAPADYVGPAPLSAPESRAMYDYTLGLSPRLTLSLHTQGEVIYWRYGECEPEGSRELGELFASLSGYALADVPPEASYAGYRDWFIEHYGRPGFTIEAGLGRNPLPLTDFDGIYEKLQPVFAAALQ